MSARRIEQSFRVTLPAGISLPVRRLADNPDGPPVLLLHGWDDAGTIFHPAPGRGLAHYLAGQGFDVYVPELRGTGHHWLFRRQRASRQQVDNALQDLPAILEAIDGLRGCLPLYWFAHGWGSTLASRFLTRYPGYRAPINGLICFGGYGGDTAPDSRRSAWWDTQYRRLRRLLVRLHLAVLQLRVFTDPVDYGKTLSQTLTYPPTLYFAPRRELGRSSPRAVKAFMREAGYHNGRLVILGRQEGNLHNYTHIGMLTHPDAERDHFPFMVNWMQEMARLRHEAEHGNDAQVSGSHPSAARGR